MHLSLELLNRQHKYLQHSYKRYNSIFVLYTGVLLARLRSFHFSDLTEWLINCTEHFLFAIIICIKIYIYTALFGRSNYLSRKKRALIAFIVFNLVGVFNEVFQNELAQRELFIFIPDSIKDLQVNLTGAFVVGLVALGRVRRLRKSGIYS
jgi:VanZ family protein